MPATSQQTQQIRSTQQTVETQRRAMTETLRQIEQKLRALQTPFRDATTQQRELLRLPAGANNEKRTYDKLGDAMKKLQDQLNEIGKKLQEHSGSTQQYMTAKTRLKELQDQAKQA